MESTENIQRSIQDQLLGQLIAARVPVDCYLTNGIRLSGSVVGHDRFTVSITSSRDGAPQMVNKGAISTIVQQRGRENNGRYS